MSKAISAATTNGLKVVNKSNSSAMVKELQDLFSGADLLLTYGPTNDEQALVRDSHRAASQDSSASQLLRSPVYNLYEACKLDIGQETP